MAPPKDIARSYPKRGLTADVGFRSEPAFVGDGAATFPTASDYAQTAASADLALGETYTLCAWARSVKPSGANHAVNIGVSGTIKASIAFFGGVPNPEVYCYNGSANMNTIGVFESDPHTWYHIAIVIKAGPGNSQIFINGIDRTASHSHTFPLSGSPVLHIGGAYSASPSGDWQGDVANVALFTSSLTEDQVRQAMRASDYASHAAIATLEAFYPLSADFNDSTGNHNATASGSPEFRPNRPQLPRGLDLARGAAQARVYTGRAVDFDGSADYLDIGRKDFGTGDFSISLWFYDQVSSGGNRSLYSKGTYNTVGGLLIYNTYGATGPGEYLMLRNDAQATGGFDGKIMFTSEATPNQWHHIAVTRTGGTVKTYFDGKIANTSTNFNPAWDINASLNSFIGARDPSTPGSFWDGFISSVKVWDTVLTDAQVAEQFHNPEQVLPTGVSASNLRRYYPLSDYNDTSGTGGRYFQDMGADGEPAEDQGSALMAFAQPVPCPQLGLQQSATRVYFERNSTRAQATLGSAPGTACTMSAWVMVDESFPYQYFMKNGTNITANAFFAFAVDNNRRLYAVQSSSILAQGSLSLSDYGEWNHVVAMTKSTAPYVRFFINGVEDTSITDSGMVAFDLTSTFVEIGSDGGANHLKGFLNDCAIWDVELSDSEVASLYNSGIQGMDVSTVQSSNLKGWWKCDDLTRFKDYSGNGINATLTASVNAASFPENASGSTIVGDFSMKRKGVSVLNAPGSGRATLAANSSLLPATGGGYTLCAFVRLQSTDNDAAVIMSTSTGADEWGTFYEGSTNKYKIVLSDGTTNILDRAFSGTVTDSEWHHIAWTIQLDATTATGETYIDGAPDLSFTRSSFNTPPTPSEFAIGYDPGNADKQANAAIACLRIYQSVLSANEIKQVYSSDLRLIKGLENE